jgi:hypothetical protein
VPALHDHMTAPMPPFDPAAGVLVKEPERAAPGYWAGCPSVLYEAGKRRCLMTYRERRPRGAESERGWRCALAASSDGVHFEDLWEVRKDDLKSPSMERFCVIPGPSGGYQLFTSYVDPADNRWRIDMLEAADPRGFDIRRARPVLTAESTGTEGVKDPYLVQVGPVSYLFASFAAARPLSASEREQAHGTADIYTTGVTTCPTGLATSDGSTDFRWHGTVLGTGIDGAWDRYQARLTCVLPTESGWVGCYDGSADPGENYEERCGLAVSADLRRWERLTADAPWITGPYGSGSVRYLDAVAVQDQWWIYYEMARPDGAHELRLHRIPVA